MPRTTMWVNADAQWHAELNTTYEGVRGCDEGCAAYLYVIFSTQIKSIMVKPRHVQAVVIAMCIIALVNAVCWIQPDKDGHVTIPNNVTIIWSWSFEFCTSLSSVTILNSVTSIGEGAFASCTALSFITVTSIGESAVYSCTPLSSITIPNSVTYIGDDAFPSCYGYGLGVAGMVNPTGVVTCVPCENRTSIDLWQNVTSIGDSAFFLCTSPSSVVIPNSVTSIDYKAFFGCSSLSSVTIPDTVTSLGGYTFRRCTSLSSVIILDSVTVIGVSAFDSCTSLSSITIPDRVTVIGDDAFYSYTSLSSVTIPNSVNSIGENVFYSCASLASIIIPDSVIYIGDGAFYGCASLSSVVIANTFASIGYGAFDGCACDFMDYQPDVHLCDCVSIPMDAFCKLQPTTMSTTTATPQHAPRNSLPSLGISLMAGFFVGLVLVCVILMVIWYRRKHALSHTYTALSTESSTYHTQDEEHGVTSAHDNQQHEQSPRYE